MTQTIKTFFITGYRSFELGIFKENDPKVTIIKKALKQSLMGLIDQGLEWVLIGGNLGTEYWAAQVVHELKEEGYGLKLGLILPFLEFGSNWNESNAQKLLEMKQWADYENQVSHQAYQNPSQLKKHTTFILTHSDGSLLLYDRDYPGKTSYFLKSIEKIQETNDYQLQLIDMFTLQDIAES